MITHDLKCENCGNVIGTIELPSHLPADVIEEKSHTHSGFICQDCTNLNAPLGNPEE